MERLVDMCGIAGFFDPRSGVQAERVVTARAMADALIHRGPDDGGVWTDENGIALAHRRLSVLDLSPEGHQPMLSACGRYLIVFNGEIYNHAELRHELEARGANMWRGHSDTEVLLAAVARYGVAAALKRFVGMFAFALWDREARSLTLARDRIGEKPLYYGRSKGVFLFGSELKALRAHPAFQAEIDRDALTLYLRYFCIPEPYCVYRGIHKLPPATYLTLNETALLSGEWLVPIPYWSAYEVAEQGLHDPFQGSAEEAVSALDAVLRGSLRGQRIADVPLGVFLSGGVDSSTVAALLQADGSERVRSYSIGFHEAGYDEAPYAREVARHLGTDHTELYVTSQDSLDLIPELPRIYDEPFADASQIPTVLLSRLTRKHVTVCLSGDGGDELFGGYNRYFWGRNFLRAAILPRQLRTLLAHALTRVEPEAWDRMFAAIRPCLPKKFRYRAVGDKIHKAAEVLDAGSADELYLRMLSVWKRPAEVVIGGHEPATLVTAPGNRRLPGFIERMMLMDLVSYLPADILVKVDRAAMSASLETRAPFLDHRVVEFACRIPLSMKLKGSEGKWLLKQVLYRHVPRALIERPKKGFSAPIDVWLRGPLRDWAENYLSERRLKEDGFFRPAPVREKWQQHLSGVRNYQHYLWAILMFQSWLDENRAGQSVQVGLSGAGPSATSLLGSARVLPT